VPLSLKAAAREAGIAKTTLLRAVRSGRVSAQKNDLGDWGIDPAELFRVFPPRRLDPQDPGSGTGGLVQDAPLPGPPAPPGATPGPTHLEVRLARAEAKLEALEQAFAREQRLSEDLRAERDRWAQQAERLALAGPPRRSWWPFRRSA
jgi:hypothetical protein